jgi:hypothetical protein
MWFCSTLLTLVVARSVATLWHSSSSDLSNHKLRIDVKLLEDRRALINNPIHKEKKTPVVPPLFGEIQALGSWARQV